MKMISKINSVLMASAMFFYLNSIIANRGYVAMLKVMYFFIMSGICTQHFYGFQDVMKQY